MGARTTRQKVTKMEEEKSGLEKRMEDLEARQKGTQARLEEIELEKKQAEQRSKSFETKLELETKQRKAELKDLTAKIADLKRDNVYLQWTKKRTQTIIKGVFDKRFRDRKELGFEQAVILRNKAAHDLEVEETICVLEDLTLQYNYLYTAEFEIIFGCNYNLACLLVEAGLPNWKVAANAHAKIVTDGDRPFRLGDPAFKQDTKNFTQDLIQPAYREECKTTRSQGQVDLKRLADRGTTLTT